MTTVDDARDGADAVRRFAAALGRQPPERFQARLDGKDGMADLCAVEAVIYDLWPATTAKELVWLKRGAADDAALLHLQAFASDGELMRAATFRLGRTSGPRAGPGW
jgi:hypothetical protein